METTIQLDLPEDFDTLCSLYSIKPQQLIQSFINQVSLPRFYSNPIGNGRWATYFFLDYIDNDENNILVDRDLETKYLNLFNRHLIDAVKESGNVSSSESEGRKILRLWHRDLLSKRSKYLTDNFE